MGPDGRGSMGPGSEPPFFEWRRAASFELQKSRNYLTNEDFTFTFVPDPEKERQASAFWPLLTGEKDVVIQEARKREVDDGVDQPRIIQVGVRADHLPGND
jgi:hypothetical protein